MTKFSPADPWKKWERSRFFCRRGYGFVGPSVVFELRLPVGQTGLFALLRHVDAESSPRSRGFPAKMLTNRMSSITILPWRRVRPTPLTQFLTNRALKFPLIFQTKLKCRRCKTRSSVHSMLIFLWFRVKGTGYTKNDFHTGRSELCLN